MTLVTARPSYSLEWSLGAAGPLLGDDGGRSWLDAEPTWADLALCAETDPEAFFPEKGGSTREAKKVCRACPVRAECLEYALVTDQRFGIWGGLSERERRRLKRGEPVPHDPRDLPIVTEEKAA